MYCSFYGFREKPFSITPDPKFLYLGKTHKEAFAHLLYGIRERGGFIVVTGEIGAGKTTLCRGLLSHLDEDTLVAFIFNPTLSALELLKSINEDFGIASRGATKKELIDELNQFLLDKRKQGKNTVLIIDEAQSLDGEVLEQIRLLSNLETDTEKLLQIILIGQPEFRHILDQPRLLQLNQRVTVRYHLRALSQEETVEYIHHRLSVIGGEDKVFFSPDALKKIWRYAKGVPRLINVLCDRGLLAGYTTRRKHIDGKMIKQACNEVSGGPTWGTSLRLARLVRRGLVPASLLGLCLVLVALALRVLLQEGRNEERMGFSSQNLATAEQQALPPPTETVSEALSSGTERTPATGMPLGALALEPEPSEDSTALARLSSGSPEAIEPSLEPLPQEEDRQGKGEGLTEAEGESRPPGESIQAAEGAQDLIDRSSSEEGADPRDRQEATEEAFFRFLYAKPLLETREEAFLAVVEQWGQAVSREEQQQAYRAAPDLYKAAKAYGFECLRLRGNINRVRELNLPAMMELRLGEALSKRYVALLAFEGSYGRIAPPLPDGSSIVPLGVLESFWYGTAYVLWRDVWGGKSYLTEGMKGDAVGRLQSSLKDLGYYSQKPSGVFDKKTEKALRAFQRDHYLDEDGILGPQTKIVLYQKLQRFEMPRLEGAT